MALIMIEGFEQIDPSIELTASQLQHLFLGMEPDRVEDWFDGTGDSVQHIADGGRIDGNCIRFSRGANANLDDWARRWGANLGFSFIPKQKMCVGWAMRFSAAPDYSIPLAIFRFDEGAGEIEQIGLWATADAKLYISATPYNADYDVLATAVNPLGMTAAGTFRYTQWTYIEFVVSYDADAPTVTVLVNGEVVMDGVSDDSFQNLADSPYLSSIHLINPSIGHWSEEAYWQEIDDLYLNDENALGPQWIVALENGAVIENEGWTGVPQDVYDGSGAVQGAEFGDDLTWALSDPPAGVGTVNGIGVNIIANIPGQIDAVRFGVAGPTDHRQTKRVSVSGGAPDRCFRYVNEDTPSGTSLTGVGLAALRGYLAANEVVV